ncbi:MAG: hypothetical protein E7616_03580 [Ruminococcaceae bacterium]|nr:hypothetical protein [Oscillospiraceae bacterium]
MDLQKYFASLGEALVAGGMPKAQSEAYCKRLSAMLESLDENTRQEKLANYGSPEDLAKRVLSISDKQKAESRTDADHKKASDDTENKNPSLEHTVNVSRDNRKAMPKMDATKPIPVVHTNESTVGSKTQNIQVASAPEREPAAASAKPTVSVAEKSEENKKPISKRGMQIFWWTAGLSSPITLFLLGCVAGLFLLGYLAILFTAVFMIVAVTVTVVLGILLALVCLAFGVVKMLPGTDAFFIGLYEFGLGMILVGGTIVFPILEYHCATLLMPYVAKKFTVFLRFTIRQIKRLVIYLYDLCRNL